VQTHYKDPMMPLIKPFMEITFITMKNKFPSQWIQKHHKHHTFVCKHDNVHIVANEYPMGEWVEYVHVMKTTSY
jgi:hypothetical protein